MKFNQAYKLIMEYPHYEITEPVDFEFEKVPEGDVVELSDHIRGQLVGLAGSAVKDALNKMLRDDTALRALQSRFKLTDDEVMKLAVLMLKSTRK